MDKLKSYWWSFGYWVSSHRFIILCVIISVHCVIGYIISAYHSLINWMGNHQAETTLIILGWSGIVSPFIKYLWKPLQRKQEISEDNEQDRIAIYQSNKVLISQIEKRDDEKAAQLIKAIKGNGRRPTLQMAFKLCKPLIQLLSGKNSINSLKMQAEGWFTISISYLNIDGEDRLRQAKKYYEKGITFYEQIEDEDKNDLKTLATLNKALLFFKEGKHDQAFAVLQPQKDPKLTCLRLVMLLQTKRFDELKRFLSENTVEIDWADIAIESWAHLNDIEKAENTYLEAIKDINGKGKKEKTEITRESIQISFAMALLHEALKLCGYWESGEITESIIPDEAKALASRILEVVLHIAERTAPNDMPADLLGKIAADLCHDAYALLGEHQGAQKMAWKLLAVQPIGGKYITTLLMHGDALQTDQLDCIDKVLSEDFHCNCWTFLQRTQIRFFQSNYKEAWELLIKACTAPGSKEEYRDVCRNLFSLGVRLQRLDETVPAIRKCLINDKPYMQYLDAKLLSHNKQHEKALAALSAIPIDKEDIELTCEIFAERGIINLRCEHWKTALEHLEFALSLSHTISTFQKSNILRGIMIAAVQLQNAIRVLEIVSEMESLNIADKEALFQKVQALAYLRQFSNAKEHMDSLYKEEPENKSYAICMGQIIGQLGHYDEAAKILEPFCNNNSDFDINASRFRIKYLILAGNFDAAYVAFNDIEHRTEITHEDLTTYMQLAYRVGEEKKASEIANTLIRMRLNGEVPNDFLKTSNDITELKQYIEDEHNSYEQICTKYLQASIVRENLCTSTMPQDFFMRTQNIPGSYTPDQKSHFTTYSTNGWRLEDYHSRPSKIAYFSVPQNARSIVISYTALLTLHELGILNKLPSRFDEIYYCNEYVHVWAEEKINMQPHQKSEATAAKLLHDAWDGNKFKEKSVPSQSSEESQDVALAKYEACPLIDFYYQFQDTDLSGVTVIRIDQFLEWMQDKQLITQSIMDDALRWTSTGRHFINTKNAKSILDSASKFVFSLPALKRLCKSDVLSQVCDLSGKEIFITEYSAQSIKLNYACFRKNEEILASFIDLTETTIKTRSEFRTFSIPDQPEAEETIPWGLIRANASSLIYASNNLLPLLSDDRTVQAIYDQHHPGLVFGSDALLLDLYENKLIDLEVFSKSYLQLLRWRYRFLIPPVEVLSYWAFQYPNKLPGAELKEIAKYASDCMQDPGMLKIMLPTHPPLPVPFRIHERWIQISIDLIFNVWGNENIFINNLDAADFTEWVIKHFIPPATSLVQPDKFDRIDKIMQTRVIYGILLRLFEMPTNMPRSDQMFQKTMSIFCEQDDLEEYISDEFDDFLMEIKHGLLSMSGHKMRRALIYRLAMRALGIHLRLNIRLAATMRELGIKIAPTQHVF